ncbi:hypothetical protein SS50377_26934 [Spironucleus salmonicida]|uniref:Uncharacterized protein n=1 Tax=Spironucleus salmonicida TaxID=348837 RepID=V6LS92_9EUKA|nr:hypothetical protein SS50377_26934 [Spironucleus salmonicida]|eukprot:EST47445.1 Hypothetical protein SS50377_12431 [Spironucleus salmonicida]
MPMPPRPATSLTAFPPRPPLHILLDQKQRTQIELSRALPRACIDPNSIITKNPPMIQTSWAMPQQRKILPAKKKPSLDGDAKFIDYVRKQIKNDMEIETTGLSNFDYQEKVGFARERSDVINGVKLQIQLDKRQCQSEQNHFRSANSTMQQRNWQNEVFKTEAEIEKFDGWTDRVNDTFQNVQRHVEERGKHDQQFLQIRSFEKRKNEIVRNTPSMNKYKSYGTGNRCEACGQIIRCQFGLEVYLKVSEKVCCSCGQYIQKK